MEAKMAQSSGQQRPMHRRTPSSKSNILRALVSPTPRADETESGASTCTQNERTRTVPLLPPDHPHAAKGSPLGERQGNVQSNPLSPPNARQKRMVVSKPNHAPKPIPAGPASPKKTKSSTNLASILYRINRSSKDLSALVDKDKENTTPPSSSEGPINTPIWAQYATTKMNSRPTTSESNTSKDIENEIAIYTPKAYSPSKQRNFNGTSENPQLRPTLGIRPQSMYVLGTELGGARGRRGSAERTGFVGRKSEDLERRKGKGGEDKAVPSKGSNIDRKTSGSSNEQASAKGKLTIAKRGGRVMAAVAAFQGRSKDQTPAKEEPALDPKVVDQAFEAVLDSRNVPEPMRQKMRSLTLRVKADFVKQDQGASRMAESSPPGTASDENPKTNSISTPNNLTSTEAQLTDEESKSAKRSRTRSRTFTFTKGDKRNTPSPTKKQRSSSKTRPASTYDACPSAPTTPRSSMDQKRAVVVALPTDYIAYLKKNQDPVTIEVGRLHKLRILLRNETVAWVDSFVSLGGMAEIVGLLHRIMGVEWREEHEDQLLHETLLCLKGLCTTERAMIELNKVADELFPALLAMLFDDEKKGPAEYTTRTIITTVLFNFLASATSSSPSALEQQASRILGYLGDPSKPEDARPVDFVLDMRSPRPYKLWCREVTHVTREVFWIFLHHLNVVPLPKSASVDSPTDPVVDDDPVERAKALAATYQQRHFPGVRPPVPAAPYIGGVEWDATVYITSHLDLLNGLIASIPSAIARNALRAELQASGFEKIFGATLRTCKEKFYSGVHDALRAWVAAAAEDGWETQHVREGPSQEEQARGCSPKKSPKKKEAAPMLDLKLDVKKGNDDDDGGWLG